MTTEQSQPQQLTLEEILSLAKQRPRVWERNPPEFVTEIQGEGKDKDLLCTIETGYSTFIKSLYHENIEIRAYHIHTRNYDHLRPFNTIDRYGISITMSSIGRKMSLGEFQGDETSPIYGLYYLIHNPEEEQLQSCEESREDSVRMAIDRLREEIEQLKRLKEVMKR